MISVCIPTYNRKLYLKEAVESVFRQTYQDYEVIILDDGSTDGTEEMIKELNLPIRYYKQSNHGLPHPYNRLAELAKGDFICFLDSDDVLFDNAIERLVKAVNGSEDKIVYGSYVRIGNEGKEVGKSSKNLYSGDITEKLFQKTFVHCVCTLIPREIFLRHGGYNMDLKVCFDLDFHLLLSLKHQYVALEEPAFKRRRHSENISAHNYQNHMIKLKVLEDFYFSKGGKEKIPKSVAFCRLSQQACRAGKCALAEKKYTESVDVLKKSLSYRFSVKAFAFLCEAKIAQRTLGRKPFP
ncbi:MAG: glycosyltransferase family 2 protein [Smithella sp.]|jgi:glycosyltransferase involved in cell wall biosynthesis|nr:glycosyltransferase family 2 protein [Smithella sp.]